jgi:O-antigen/teichoic acid export membrane protein
VEGAVDAAAPRLGLGAHEAQAVVSELQRRLASLKMFGSAVISQALLSAANFAAGVLLIRHTSDQQYGYYILASAAILLIVSLQGAFFNPPLVNRLTPLDREGRCDLVGGLYRDQNRVLCVMGILSLLASVLLWQGELLSSQLLPLVLITIVATLAVLHRNFFRLALLAYRRSQDVLRTDIGYVVILVVGILIAVRAPQPALSAIVVTGVAAALSGIWTSRALRRHEPWNVRGMPGILKEVAPTSSWSTAGAGIHWAFSQGYMYLAAATLDVTAVAAIAATRLLMMPVNLLSTGIGTLMLSMTSGWLHHHGLAVAFRRLTLFALGLGAVSLCYFVVLWLLRDWIFADVLQKQFAERDQLLLLWSAAFLAMVVRDQLLYLLVARERFKQLTSLAFISAMFSLIAGYVSMQHWGVIGAPAGVLIGELVNLTGILFLALRQGTTENRDRPMAAELSAEPRTR